MWVNWWIFTFFSLGFSATIMSAGEGKLIRIPKVSFVNLIRKNPHYGIFLSKLLAQRVVRQNQRTLELAAEVADLKMKRTLINIFLLQILIWFRMFLITEKREHRLSVLWQRKMLWLAILKYSIFL